jgi:hypothetical protein
MRERNDTEQETRSGRLFIRHDHSPSIGTDPGLLGGHIEFLEKSIASLESKIDAHLEPYREQYVLLQTIPGVNQATAA